MRILFVHPNYHSGGAEIAGTWPPAWVAYLAGSLKAAGFTEIHFIDAMTENVTPEDLRARMIAYAPDVVGTTAITPAIYEAEAVLKIAAEVAPDALRVLGGIHATFMYRQVLSEAPWVDVIVRGEGPWIWDDQGRRYFDGLSGLFTVQVGHGRAELAEAARAQSETLAYFPVWSFAHEPAITLATRLAEYAPGDLNRAFFTPSGGDAVETAMKLARQYWKLRGQHSKTKVISRYLAYHGTTLGALSLTGVPAIKTPFEPLMPGAIKVQTPYRYRCHDCMNLGACTLRCADDLALRIEMEGADSMMSVTKRVSSAVLLVSPYSAR